MAHGPVCHHLGVTESASRPLPSSAATSSPEMADLDDRLGKVLRKRIEGLTRLTGGASRETWAFDAVDVASGSRQELVLRRDPPGAPRNGMELEARLLRVAAAAGVPVPTVRSAGPADPQRLVTSYMVMDRVEGETIARRIQREPQYAPIRTSLASECGVALARLHGVDPTSVPGLETYDPLDRYETLYRDLGHRVAVFDMAFAWLRDHRPSDRPAKLVHGDFRLGNLMLAPDRLAAVLDWELSHIGDPMEDLAWLSIRAWRFGGDGVVGGVGSLEDLFQSYERNGGVVDRAAFDWWMVAGTLMWGVMCIMQANAHLSGAIRSVELAAIGRRVVEQEHDVLLLLDPEGLAAAKARANEPASMSAVPDALDVARSDDFGLPSAAGLVESVREFLERDVMTNTTGRVQFHARIAVNVLNMVQRQLQAPPLSGGLADDVVARLNVANPRHLS